VGFLCKIDGIF